MADGEAQVSLQKLVGILKSPSGQKDIPSYRQLLKDILKTNTALCKQNYADVILDFFGHVLKTCPEIFAANSNVTMTEEQRKAYTKDGILKEGTEEYKALDISLFTMLRLLDVLTSAQVSDTTRSRIMAIIDSLYMVLLTHNRHLHWIMISELFNMLKTLSVLEESFYDVQCDVTAVCYLDHFSLSQYEASTDSSTTKQMTCSDAEECERIQVILCDVILLVIGDVPTYLSSDLSGTNSIHINQRWSVLMAMIDNGEVIIKQKALDICTGLIVKHMLDCIDNMPLFIHYITSTLEVCAKEQKLEDECFKQLDLSVVDCLSRLVSALILDEYKNKQNLQFLRSTLFGIATVMTDHGVRYFSHFDALERLSDVFLRGWLHLTTLGCRSPVDLDERHKVALMLLEDAKVISKSERLLNMLGWIIITEVDSYLRTNLTNQDSKQRIGVPLHSTPICSMSHTLHHIVELLKSTLQTVNSSKSLCLDEMRYISLLVCVISRTTMDLTEDDTCRHSAHLFASPTVHRRTHANTRPNYLSRILTNAQIILTIECCRSQLNICSLSQNRKVDVSQHYDVVVTVIEAFVYVYDLADCYSFIPDFVSGLIWMASVPWLSSEVSWLDLKVNERKKILNISAIIGDKLDASTRSHSLRALCLIPKEESSLWRCRLLQSALVDTDAVVRSTAIEVFPYFLYFKGPALTHMIDQNLHECLKSADVSVQKSLAKSVGALACIFSKRSLLHRPLHSSKVCREVKFHCSVCTRVADICHDKTKDLPMTLFMPFLQLLNGNSEIKLEFLSSLQHIFTHISVQTHSSQSVTFVQECLVLLNDPNRDVRLKFSEILPVVIQPPNSIDLAAYSAILLTAFKNIKDQQDCVIQTQLYTVGRLGRISEGKLLLQMIGILLDCLCAPPCHIAAAVSHRELKLIAQHKNMKMNDLILNYSKDFFTILVDLLYKSEFQEYKKKSALQIIQEIASLFNFEDTKAFLTRTEQYIIPYLVKKATPEATQLIRLVAKQLGDPNHKGPLMRNIQYIYCHLVCSCGQEEFTRILKYLKTESEYDISTMLRYGTHRVESELLLYLSSHQEQVMSGLKFLAIHLCLVSKNPEEVTNQQIADMLQPKLLGTLVYFDNYLCKNSVLLEEKKQAFLSIISLIRLMGSKHITAVRIRMMTTLRIALNYKSDNDFAELGCKAWSCFVRSIDLEALGPMLSQIVVNIQPLLPIVPKLVADIYRYLIVEHQNAMHPYFNELYFIPDIKELAEVNKILQSYAKLSEKNNTLKMQIVQLMPVIQHEIQDVRLLALNKMVEMLRANQDDLHVLIHSSETVDPIISELVNTILSGCQTSDLQLRSVYAECLGVLGAIDPGRLDLKQSPTLRSTQSFQSSAEDDNFAVDLIIELSKAFRRAEDNHTQDSVSFSIQELLKVYNISSDPGHPGYQMWRKFSDSVQEIIVPLMDSRYKLNITANWFNLPKPIYRSKKGQKFAHWVSNWAGYLVSKIQAERVSSIFEACRGVVKLDSNIAFYILPHLVVQVLLDGAQAEYQDLCTEVLAVVEHMQEAPTSNPVGRTSDFRHMSSQTVYSILDYLKLWMRHRSCIIIEENLSTRNSRVPSIDYMKDDQYRCVQGFINAIPQNLLAQASFNCESYTRALMHYEQFMRLKKAETNGQLDQNEHLDFLQRLYAALDDADGVEGVTAIRNAQPSLNEQIRAYESKGNLSEATLCYDRAIQLNPHELSHRHGLLRCYLSLGEFNSALDLVSGTVAKNAQWSGSLNVYKVEALWKLGQWDDLPKLVESDTPVEEWNMGVANALLAVKNKESNEFHDQLRTLRTSIMAPLSAASMEVGSYHRGYEYIVRLHILNELELGVQSLFGFDRNSQSSSEEPLCTPAQLLEQWESRLQFTQNSFKTRESILHLRRTVLSLARQDEAVNLDAEIGRCWLNIAQVAREGGLMQTAQRSLLTASSYNLPEFCIEKAKWLWDRNDFDKAQGCLENAIKQYYPNKERLTSKQESLACAKVMLLLGNYCEETSSWESNAIMKYYKEVVKVNAQFEEGYFYIAKYYNKIMNNLVEVDKLEKKGDFVVHVVNNYGLSLQYGNQFIYQSMPRMLALWLDYGAEVVENDKKEKSAFAQQAIKASLATLNQRMSQFADKLNPFQFLTAFPQLISRICHAHPDVSTNLKEVIAKIMVAFPQQTMWMLMAVSKSSYKMRAKRCREIFNQAKSLSTSLEKFIEDSIRLTDRLLELCNKPVDGSAKTLSISTHFKTLQRFLDNKNLSAMLLPLQSQMTVTLPSGSEGRHDPFPGNMIYIRGIHDTVEVLQSLQLPKKVTLLGSDGGQYIFLCKPKDDLRKDARLMEFNAIVNKCLRKNHEARRRDLHIRTYTVTPLNEECGLLEWVSNTTGFRSILMGFYRERGIYTGGRELKAMALPANASAQKKLEMYRTKLIPRHPPMFHYWFQYTFADPTSWYNAQLSYSRTSAVMCMVGYILGLGDRHGENILLDSTNGDVVHVDFNCLFNKGETFDFPEIVPFRLTHNMVDAMGCTGYEGTFRQSCEFTLRVMREQHDSLMSVLKSFVYDPLVEWNKPVKGRANPAETGEIKNELAFSCVNNIDQRLRGSIKNRVRGRSLALSVEGHVNHLIKEATSEDNLSQMYIGWAPYL